MSDDDSQTPNLAQLLTAVVEKALRDVSTALPGRVLAYNDATGTVDVQITVYDVSRDEADNRQVKPYPVLVDVPLVFQRGRSGGVTFPVEVGDGVIVVFASRSMDLYLAVGGDVDPGDERRHDMSDAIAIPGLFDRAHQPAGGAPTNAVVLHSTSVIKLMNANAADPVVRKSDLDQFRATYNTHTHPAPGGTTSAPTQLQASIACSPDVKVP